MPSSKLTNPSAPASTTPALFNTANLSGVSSNDVLAFCSDCLNNSTKSGVLSAKLLR